MQRDELERAIGVIDVAMLGAGAAVGVSIFSVLAPAARVGGSGILLTVLVAALPMMVFAIVYGFMASVLPKSGASYEWPREYIHPFVGFLVAWLRIIGSVGVLVTLSLVFVQYASMVVRLPTKPTMFCLLSCIFLLNIRGIKIAARAQTVAMLLLLAAFAIFVVAGLPRIDLARVGNPLAHGIMPVLAALPLLITLFLGIETATEVGEEVKDARRAIPIGIAIALCLSVAVYLAIAFTTLGILGPEGLAASSAPLLEASQHSLGRFGAPLILAAACLAIPKSLNAIFIVFTRYLYAMARSGILPAPLARIHRKWGTPYVAVIVAFLCAIIGLALPEDLIFLFVAISIPTILKYASTSLSAFNLAGSQPQLVASSQLGLRTGTVRALAVLGIACGVLIFAVGFDTDWRPYVLIGAWGLVGWLYWIIRRRITATPGAQVVDY